MIARTPASRAQASRTHSRVEGSDLHNRLRAILVAEEADPPEWMRVVCLSEELQRQLLANSRDRCPRIVSRYVDDADIRIVDPGFAKRQRDEIRRFLATGRCRARIHVTWPMIATGLLLLAAAWLFV